MGARIAEIQELTQNHTWRYLDSASNTADDMMLGKSLRSLTEPSRWSQGPPFQLQYLDSWPEKPNTDLQEDLAECPITTLCALRVTSPTSTSNPVYETWQKLIKVKALELHRRSPPSSSDSPPSAEDYQQALRRP